MKKVSVLVVGAGMAGLTCASRLARSGIDVQVVEKARGSGGRLASKRWSVDNDACVFDLGAPYLKADTCLFQQQLEQWQRQGIVDVYENTCHERVYVSVPRSSMVTRHLCQQLDVAFATRVSRIEKTGQQWNVYVESGEGEQLYCQSRAVILATPAEQAAALMPKNHLFCQPVSEIRTEPQWVVTIATHDDLVGNGFLANSQSLRGIAVVSCDSEKPGRSGQTGCAVWTLHMTPEWSRAYIDDDPETIFDLVMEELSAAGGKPIQVASKYTHRWLYSQFADVSPFGEAYLFGRDGLGICGDYFSPLKISKQGSRRYGVESSFLSGTGLAVAICKDFQLKAGLEGVSKRGDEVESGLV